MKKPYFLPTVLIPPHLSFGEAGRGLFFIILLLLPLLTNAQVIVTCAGGGSTGLGDGGPAVNAELNQPYAINLDDSGNLYICDVLNERIRKVSNPANLGVGIITTIAGNGVPGYSGDHGLGINAELDGPSDVAIDHHGNVYIADANNNCIRKVTPLDTISTIAGTGIAGYNGDGISAITAQLNLPYGVAVDSIGNIYIADGQNHRIRRVDISGIITTIAGTGIAGFSPDDSRADTAKLDVPCCIRMDKAGNLFFYDSARIRKIDTAGIIITIAGNGVYGFTGDSGLATSAEIGGGTIAIDSLGNLFFPDAEYNHVRKVDTAGIITTVVGTGIPDFYGDNGNPLLAELNNPEGIAMSNTGDIYIGDVDNYRVRLVTLHPVGIYNITDNGVEINIYPNPANEEVTVASVIKGNNELIITDVLGRLIYKDSFTDKIQIPVAYWQAGVYYVQVVSENGYKNVQKLIVQ